MKRRGLLGRAVARLGLLVVVVLSAIALAPARPGAAAYPTTLKVDYFEVYETDDTMGDDEAYLIVFGGWRRPNGTADRSGTWSVSDGTWDNLGSGWYSAKDVTVTSEHSSNRIYAVIAMDRDDGNDFANNSAARQALAAYMAAKFYEYATPGRSNNDIAQYMASRLRDGVTTWRTNDDIIDYKALDLASSWTPVVWFLQGQFDQGARYVVRFKLTP